MLMDDFPDENGGRQATTLDERSACASHVGAVRTNNEDYFGGSFEGDVMVLADGMGGHPRGEEAAKVAVTTVLAELTRTPKRDWPTNADGVTAAMRRAIDVANRAVMGLATPNDMDNRHPGCTLVMSWRIGSQFVFAHVGDSRAYIVHNEKGIRQLTEDHAYAGMLTRSLGMPSLGRAQAWADVGTVPREPRARLLLCTDGLTGALSPTEILTAFRRNPAPRGIASDLIRGAVNRGARDNVTVMISE